MNRKMSIEQICAGTESSEFDRKSARINAKALAVHLIAFANTDGGTIAIGIEDDGTITGIDRYVPNINELLRASFDYCKPSVQIETERLDCVNNSLLPDHILLINVLQSSELHANQADEVFFRIGDKSKKLNFEERVQLMYAKGTRYFEDTPVPDATMDDIDLDFVKSYCEKIGYHKSPVEYLKENKEFVFTKNNSEKISSAAMLLFGKNTKHFFPRARVRFIRYEGTEAKVGAEMNVIKDVIFDGRILQIVKQTLDFVGSQIKEYTYLGADTKFITRPEYPEFAWKEIVINAIAHRDYSIKGTDIQIKMFDDRLVVESPGTLPGIVRINNMRHVHFSRNPKIAQFLHEYKYVQEFGEGVDRLFNVMEAAGLPQPEYKVEAFMLIAAIRNKTGNKFDDRVREKIGDKYGDRVEDKVGDRVGDRVGEIELSENQKKIIALMLDNPRISAAKMAMSIGISSRKVEENIKKLKARGIIARSGSAHNGQWIVL